MSTSGMSYWRDRLRIRTRLRVRSLGIWCLVRQVEQLPTESAAPPAFSVIQVGHGQITIPPPGWGAVEILIDQQSKALSRLGVAVTILNSEAVIDWLRAFRGTRPDVVIVHGEQWFRRAVLFSRLFGARLLVCSHNPYLGFPERWQECARTVRQLERADGKADAIIALSPSIAEALQSRMRVSSRVFTVPNASDLSIAKRAPTRDVLMLGKVSPRKRQWDVATALEGVDFRIDFVGEIEDPRVLRDASRRGDLRFLGPWTREQVVQNLADYRVLLLVSEAEADALVLYEAQLAGLSVVVSPGAVGAQELDKPWVYLLDEVSQSGLIRTLRQAIQENPGMRDSIRDFAEQEYRWDRRMRDLIFLMRQSAILKPEGTLNVSSQKEGGGATNATGAATPGPP